VTVSLNNPLLRGILCELEQIKAVCSSLPGKFDHEYASLYMKFDSLVT
jgi:hypothetical protein